MKHHIMQKIHSKISILIILPITFLMLNGCKKEEQPDPIRIKGFDLIVVDKNSEENLLGTVYPLDEIKIYDSNGDLSQLPGNVYYDNQVGYVIADITYDFGRVREYYVRLNDNDTDTLSVEIPTVVLSNGFYFYYNGHLTDSVKNWNEWGLKRGTQPIIRAIK